MSILYSYCGAQIFEVYGLGKEVVDLAFRGSVSKIGGLTFDEVRKNTELEHMSENANFANITGNMSFYLFISHFFFLIKESIFSKSSAKNRKHSYKL